MTRQIKFAMLAAIIGNSIFGFSFMFSRIALNTATPFVMLMYRFLLAFILLNGVAFWSARRKKIANTDSNDIHWLRFKIEWKNTLPLIAMGVIQPVAYFLCESYGISLTNATFSGVIIALIPIVALGAGIFLLGEYPRKSQVLFSIISILGVILMTLQQRAEGAIQFLGVLLLIGAVVTGMAFSVISRKLSAAYSALERTYVMMLIGAVAFTLLAVVECRNNPAALIAPLKDPGFLGAILYLGLFSSIIAFMCLNYANNYLSVAKATAFCNLTTVISLFAGVIFLHEPFTLASLIASILIILGIWGVQRAG